MSDPPRTVLGMDLTDTERDMLAFERQWFAYTGTKEQLIRERFGLSVPRYYLALNRLLDSPAALAHDPFTVKRLRRVRESRMRTRSSRRLSP